MSHRPSGTPVLSVAQPRVPLVPRCTRGYFLPSLRDSSRGWVLNPEFRSWLAALGGYCLPSLRDSSRGRVPNPEFRSWLAALGATVCRPSGTRLVVGCPTPSSARGSLHSGLLAAVPPGLVSWSCAQPRVPLVARCTRGYCLPSLPPGLVSWSGAQPRVPLVPRYTRGYWLPSLRDTSLALLWSRSFPLQLRFLGLANSCHTMARSCHTMARSCHTMARLCHAMANCCHRINISVAKNLPAGPALTATTTHL